MGTGEPGMQSRLPDKSRQVIKSGQAKMIPMHAIQGLDSRIEMDRWDARDCHLRRTACGESFVAPDHRKLLLDSASPWRSFLRPRRRTGFQQVPAWGLLVR